MSSYPAFPARDRQPRLSAYERQIANPAWNSLRQFDPQLAADRACRAAQSAERHGRVVWIEQAVELSAVGTHARGHGGLGEALRLHRLPDLPGEHALDGDLFGILWIPYSSFDLLPTFVR
jgi:hypothetical protein